MANTKEHKKHLVAQSNTLIDARHRLNTHQQRVFMLFVSKIRPKDTPDRTYCLRWNELYSVSKGYLSTRNRITEIFTELLSKRVDLSRDMDEAAGFISWFKNDHERQEVLVRVDMAIQQELFALVKQYTLYNLECSLGLESPYHIRLYTMLKARLFKCEHGPVQINLDDLKWSLGCQDVKTYDLWANFNRYVLDKAQTAIGMHTDIKFTYTPLKARRKVQAILFMIQENKQWQSTIHQLLPAATKISPQRDYVLQGDIVIIDDERCEVGPSVAECKGKTYGIGQLTTFLREGKIELI